jgi:hypothetical protein
VLQLLHRRPPNIVHQRAFNGFVKREPHQLSHERNKKESEQYQTTRRLAL